MKIGILGGAGYTGGELIRLLLQHPQVELHSVVSESQKGLALSTIHRDLLGETNLAFSDQLAADTELLFLCMGHGRSAHFLAKTQQKTPRKIIDLSTDFRPLNNGQGFVYGLPERNKPEISAAERIANPGCFATAIQLAILPLAAGQKLRHDLHIHGITGSTGAGQKPQTTTHFSWRNNNLSIYKLFEHQHQQEIGASIRGLQASYEGELHFVPLRGDFPRGIFISAYTETELTEAALLELYQDYYADAPFTFATTKDISLKEVVNTNKCLIQVRKHGKNVHLTAVIDNLLKGASGQAVQNMNLMLGWEETLGLQLKSIAF